MAQDQGTLTGLPNIDDCVDSRGEIALPTGLTLVSLIERNDANVGEAAPRANGPY